MPAADSLFLSIYMGLDERMRLRIGHSFDPLIKACTFKGIDCKNSRLVWQYRISLFYWRTIDIFRDFMEFLKFAKPELK